MVVLPSLKNVQPTLDEPSLIFLLLAERALSLSGELAVDAIIPDVPSLIHLPAQYSAPAALREDSLCGSPGRGATRRTTQILWAVYGEQSSNKRLSMRADNP